VEIELLDADGGPRPTRPDHERRGRGRSPRRHRALTAVAVGLVAAVSVLLIGGVALTAVRDHLVDDLDRRLTAVATEEALSVQATGRLSTDTASGTVAVQVLQSPGTVVESTGSPADRPMVAEIPSPGTTELSTFAGADETSARIAPVGPHRVAATTLPTAAGVAGRTVVAAVAPTSPIERDVARLRTTVIALAIVVGAGAALVTDLVARRRRGREATA
jgi:hypothetical protein